MSINHNVRPIKYCMDCEFHFKALPRQHGETYHEGEGFIFVEGTWRDAKLNEFL